MWARWSHPHQSWHLDNTSSSSEDGRLDSQALQQLCTAQFHWQSLGLLELTIGSANGSVGYCKTGVDSLTVVEEEGVMSNSHSFINISIRADDASALSCNAGIPISTPLTLTG